MLTMRLLPSGNSLRSMAMDRIAVQSSNIRSVGYNSGSSTLEIEFNSGRVYQYLSVPKDEDERLMSASSKGRYFNNNIKDAYQDVRIR